MGGWVANDVGWLGLKFGRKGLVFIFWWRRGLEEDGLEGVEVVVELKVFVVGGGELLVHWIEIKNLLSSIY